MYIRDGGVFMLTVRAVSVIALGVCAMILWAVLSPAIASGEPLRLRVMTFNLKYASESGTNKWSDRRHVLKNAILSEEPDLIGTQEGLYSQIKHIDEDLPDYDWIGLGRAGGSKDEFMAIFYKHERLEPMAYDHFWLSDTPNVIGSRTWGNNNRRMVTWVRFRDKVAGVEFYHWNTHFDHEVQTAREKSADLLVSELRKTKPVRPVVVTGDFNASQTDIVHKMMLARNEGQIYLLDAWDEAETHDGTQVATGHGWRGPGNNTRRIDWVLISPPFKCKRAKVVTYQENGQYPSDHFPVACDLELLRSE
jgi:endonuclease/exonuclease/phosphatase family metal-dependent hydrolase